jgi:hypothetical protein
MLGSGSEKPSARPLDNSSGVCIACPEVRIVPAYKKIVPRFVHPGQEESSRQSSLNCKKIRLLRVSNPILGYPLGLRPNPPETRQTQGVIF